MLFLFANLQIRNQPSHKTKRSVLLFVRTASFYARLLRVVSYALAMTRRKVRGGNGVLNVQRGRAVTHGHNVEIAGKFIGQRSAGHHVRSVDHTVARNGDVDTEARVSTTSPSPTLFSLLSDRTLPPAAKKTGSTNLSSIIDWPVPKASSGSSDTMVTFLPCAVR